MPRSVLVVGMPRSGTSMAAGIFARAGYHVSDEPEADLRPGDAANPDGYWEAESLIQRNVEVFEAAGYPHHNTWLFDPIDAAAVKRIAELEPLEEHRAFVAEHDAHAPWIWKDPRLCYTLAYWWKLLDPDRTRVVLTQRDPEAIFRSFVRLGWRDPDAEAQADVLARVDDHLAAATSAIETLEIPHVVLEYEKVAEDPRPVAREISAMCDLDLHPDDLGFDRRFDHSGVRGRISTWIHRSFGNLPEGPRRLLKGIVPKFIVTALFPERAPPDDATG